jgi:16S rRNA (uracil1498-N3)-methyltransferase
MPRLYCPIELKAGDTLSLPAGAARHVQVLRLQPGDAITLFNGTQGDQNTRDAGGGEFDATVTRMGRNEVEVRVGQHHPVEREAARAVHLAVGMPANDRMDWLIEKATELGVASVQPLITERSVLRLSGERADKKQAHWQSIAVAACEQCGRNRVPLVHPVKAFAPWAKTALEGSRYLLSLRPGSLSLRDVVSAGGAATSAVTFLSGPEGGLSEAEEQIALALGFAAVSLGARVLRAETAALAALTLLA